MAADSVAKPAAQATNDHGSLAADDFDALTAHVPGFGAAGGHMEMSFTGKQQEPYSDANPNMPANEEALCEHCHAQAKVAREVQALGGTKVVPVTGKRSRSPPAAPLMMQLARPNVPLSDPHEQTVQPQTAVCSTVPSCLASSRAACCCVPHASTSDVHERSVIG